MTPSATIRPIDLEPVHEDHRADRPDPAGHRRPWPTKSSSAIAPTSPSAPWPRLLAVSSLEVGVTIDTNDAADMTTVDEVLVRYGLKLGTEVRLVVLSYLSTSIPTAATSSPASATWPSV